MGRRTRTLTSLTVVLSLLSAACSADPVSETTTTETVPEAAVPPPPTPAPIAVGLRRSTPFADANLGDEVGIAGFYVSEEDTVRLEFWDGEQLVESRDIEAASTEGDVSWSWTPASDGIHALVLRAFDDNGRAATSFPLWVRVREPDRPEALSPGIRPVSFNQLTATASVGSNCEASVEVSPVQSSVGIAVYAAPMGSPGFLPVDLLPPQAGVATLGDIHVPTLVYFEPFDDVSATPQAPQLLLPPNPCIERGWNGLSLSGGLLSGAGEAEAAYLYVSYDEGVSWDRAPAVDQEFVYPDADGQFDFAPHLLPGSPTLMFEAWGLFGGQPAPLGTGAWVNPDTGNGKTGGAGVAYAGPVFASSDLDWVITETFTTRSGLLCTYPPQVPTANTTPTVPVSVVGGSSTTSTTGSQQSPVAVLPDHCLNAPFGGYSKIFRWKPSTAVHQGLLQVSTLPPPSGPAVTFPGLVYTKGIDGGQSTPIDFEFDPIGFQIKTVAESQPGGVNYQAILNPASLGGAQFGKPPTFGPSGPETLYLRVLPTSNGQIVPGESNDVVIDFEENPPPPPVAKSPTAAISVSVEMVPPRLPNPSYQRCARVIANPFGAGNPPPSTTPQWFTDRGKTPPAFSPFPDSTYAATANSAYSFENGVKVNKGLVPGSTVCAWQPTPPAKGLWDYMADAVNFVAWVWDTYATLYDMAKAAIVQVLVKVTGCEVLAEAAGASEEEAAKGCGSVANLAVNTGLSMIGLPPTIPKASEVMEAAKEDLATFLVKSGVEIGLLDCGETLQTTCEDLFKEMVDTLLDETQVQLTNALVTTATAGQNWILAIHPGIYITPEPAGILSPAVFTVTITRSPEPGAPPPPAMCTYTAHVSGVRTSYQWKDYTDNSTKSGPLSTGGVMVPGTVEVDLTGLKPGDSKTAVILLDKPVAWYLPGQNPQLPGVPSWVKPSTWVFMTSPESTLTTTLIGSEGCGSAFQDHVQDSISTEPWEIPYP